MTNKEIIKSELKQSKLPSCSLDKTVLKKIYKLICEANEEAKNLAIEDLKKTKFETEKEYDDSKTAISTFYRVSIIVTGANGELFLSEDESIFDDVNLPTKVTRIEISNNFFYKNQLKFEPNYKILLIMDFSTPRILDYSLKPSFETPNYSTIEIMGFNKTWVSGTYDNIMSLINERKSKSGWLHKQGIYDLLIWILIIPITFYYLNKLSSFLGLSLKFDHVLLVGIHIYLFIIVLFVFMFLFKYSRWVYPYLDLKTSFKKGSVVHRSIFYILSLSLLGSILYDLFKTIF